MNIQNLLPDHYLEHEYFNKMFQFLDQETFKDITIYVSHDYHSLPSYGKNVIAILTAGDESGTPPKYASDVRCVFKHHLDQDQINNTFHIPLPYPNKFSGNSKIPIQKRNTDIFFSGCRRGSRKFFLDSLAYFMKQTRYEYRFDTKITNKFGSGYSLKVYSDIMSRSKIALSPRGWVRSECIRFSEAVRCGCAIIADRQPEVTCFQDTPYYSIDQWTPANLSKGVEYCMENQKKIHEGMNRSWDLYFSPQAVANKINTVVGG